MRLLRPIHPFVTYAALHLSAIPLRALVAVPFAIALLFSSASELIITDAPRVAILVGSLAGAWMLTFFMLMFFGALGFFLERSLALFDIYLGVFAVLSGYLLPLDLLPEWARAVAEWAPFRYMLAFPVELMTGRLASSEALAQLATQWLYVVATMACAFAVWRGGVRRYEAYGS